jgi:hypothetical protein
VRGLSPSTHSHFYFQRSLFKTKLSTPANGVYVYVCVVCICACLCHHPISLNFAFPFFNKFEFCRCVFSLILKLIFLFYFSELQRRIGKYSLTNPTVPLSLFPSDIPSLFRCMPFGPPSVSPLSLSRFYIMNFGLGKKQKPPNNQNKKY